MSDGHWQQQEQYHNTFINYHNQAAEETNTDYSEGHRLSTRGARAGALLAEVYSGGPKGGIAPPKVLFHWTKKLVSFCIPSFFVRCPPRDFLLLIPSIIRLTYLPLMTTVLNNTGEESRNKNRLAFGR